MISTLFSLIGGGLLRMLPEIIHYFNKKIDNSHELAMIDKQIQLETLKAQAAKEAAQTQVTIEDSKSSAEALSEQFQMLADHFQTSGNRLVDGIVLITRNVVDVLNMLVRPTTAYYFLSMFGIYKAALLSVALCKTSDIWQSILQVYTPDDAHMLAGILAFYFVGRSFDRKAR